MEFDCVRLAKATGILFRLLALTNEFRCIVCVDRRALVCVENPSLNFPPGTDIPIVPSGGGQVASATPGQ